jgi:hypothetical protein
MMNRCNFNPDENETQQPLSGTEHLGWKMKRKEKMIIEQIERIPSAPEMSSEYLAQLLATDAMKRKKLVEEFGITAYLVSPRSPFASWF